MSQERRRAYNLLKLNLALQAFDGIATYLGLRLGFQEANPILVMAFHYLGVGPALLLFKVKACSLLVLLHRHGDRNLVVPALHLLAAIYAIMSFGPWLANYVALLSHAI
jgi:uncharacterized protein DUF5658